MSLAVAIIARDEARHLAGALASVAHVADELLVLVDDRTSDQTATIAEAHGARVQIEPWRGFSAQRNRALELCDAEWVLFLDADERVDQDLAAELRDLAGPHMSDYAGFWIPRHNHFFGQVAYGGGWYPDPQLRLLRRTRAWYDPAQQVHEVAQLKGEAGTLCGHLEHINIEHVDEFWHKQRAYAFQEAQTLFRAGRRARWRNFVGAPAREFFRRYIQLGGWRDGMLGLMLCGTLAWFEVIKFMHLKGLATSIDAGQY